MANKSTRCTGKSLFKSQSEQRQYLREQQRKEEEAELLKARQLNAQLSNQLYLARLRREEAERRNNPLNVLVTATNQMIDEDLETIRIGRLLNKK